MNKTQERIASRKRVARAVLCFKHRPYDGILKKPIIRKLVIGPDPGRTPVWFVLKSLPEELWPTLWESILSIERRQKALRLCALFQHYSIDLLEPTAAKDLALTLAIRHERHMLAEDGRAAYGKMFKCRNLDPNDPEADLVLALDLADKHVPGFKLDRKVPRHGTKRKLKERENRTSAQVRGLASIVAALSAAGAPECKSAHGICNLMNKPTKPEHIRRDVWREIQEGRRLYRKTGQTDSGRTVRRDLGGILKAVQALRQGKINHLQSQLIFEVAEMDDKIRMWLESSVDSKEEQVMREEFVSLDILPQKR